MDYRAIEVRIMRFAYYYNMLNKLREKMADEDKKGMGSDEKQEPEKPKKRKREGGAACRCLL